MQPSNIYGVSGLSYYPTFKQAGLIDVTDYNQGKRGGKVKVRAHIEEVDKKTVAIKSVTIQRNDRRS
jgi:hypothetical protein